MTDERTIRSFLALDPPEEILREIGRIQDRLQKLIHGDVRWVRPEAIHLTLKFFGDISENAVANISAVAGKAAAAVGPFELAIGGAGVFPDIEPAPGHLAGDERGCGAAGDFSEGAGAGAPGDRLSPGGAALPAASHPGTDQVSERADGSRGGAGKGRNVYGGTVYGLRP